MMSSLPSFQPFSLRENAPYIRWKKRKLRLDYLILAMGVKNDKERYSYMYSMLEKKWMTFLILYQSQEMTKTPLKPSLQKTLRQTKIQNSKFINLDRQNRKRPVCRKWQGVKVSYHAGCNSTRLRRRALRQDMRLNVLLKPARYVEISDRQVENWSWNWEMGQIYK